MRVKLLLIHKVFTFFVMMFNKIPMVLFLLGAFPFGFFATNFNWGDQGLGATGPAPGSAQYEEEQFLHRVFLWVAFAFIFWLLIA